MKIIVKTKEEIDALILEQVQSILDDKPNAVFGFDPHSSLQDTYEKLRNAQESGEISFEEASAFVTCEYLELDKDRDGSKHRFMNECLFDGSSFAPGNIFFPCSCTEEEEELKKYDEQIEQSGGIDLMILGIGNNGSMGFNEPATPFDTYTHCQLLTDKTKAMVAEDFGGAENVPEKGVTMGIKTIIAARNIVLVATGEEKADIVHKVVYGKTATFVPASMLQIHMNMILYLDEAAASKI